MKKINELTLSSIMVAINIIFVILNFYLPFFSLIILIGIPFSCALVKLKCNYKYTLLYIISSILICFLIDYQSTLFYLLPSLISGLSFGILIKKNIHAYYLVHITALINVIVQYFIIFIMNKLFQIDFISSFCEIIKMDTFSFQEIVLSFFYIFSFIQIILTYFILENEIKKFNYQVNEQNTIFYSTFIIEIILLSSSIIFLFTYKPMFYLINCLAIINSCYILYYLSLANFKIIPAITYFFSLILCCIFYKFIKENGFHLLFTIFSITTLINDVIFIIYTSFIKNLKINSTLFDKTNENNEY